MSKPGVGGLEKELFTAAHVAQARLHPAVRRFLEQVGEALDDGNNSDVVVSTEPAGQNSEHPVSGSLPPEIISLLIEQNNGENDSGGWEDSWVKWSVSHKPQADTGRVPSTTDADRKPAQTTRTETKLPADVAYANLLDSSIRNLPAGIQETVRSLGVKILGAAPAGNSGYNAEHLSDFERFVVSVEKLIKAGNDAYLTNFLAEELQRLRSGFPPTNHGNPPAMQVQTNTVPQPAHRKRESREPVVAPSPRLPQHKPARIVPAIPAVKNAAYYLSRLKDSTKTLPTGMAEPAVSYLMRVLDVDSETAIPAAAQRRALADDFIRIVKNGITFDTLPQVFYKALDKIHCGDVADVVEFQKSLNRSGSDRKKITEVLSDYVDTGELDEPEGQTRPTGYSKAVEAAADLYKEDPGMVAVVGKAKAFEDGMVAARNALAGDETAIRNFYGVMKTIAEYGMNRGSVYRDVLKLIRDSSAQGRVFLGRVAKGVSSMQDLDKELGKYTAIGPRFYEK